MIFVTGPLFAGKKEYVCQALGWSEEDLSAKAAWDVQDLAAQAEDLEALADDLSAQYPVLIATEVGGGVVPMDPAPRVARDAAGEELTASGGSQVVPDSVYDYIYNEQDGVAYRSWFDEVGALHVAELGTFTQMTGDAPGENTGDIDFEMMAGTWFLDAEADAPSILVFDENGGWELLERPGGDGDPTVVDCGTNEVNLDGAGQYIAASTVNEDVV